MIKRKVKYLESVDYVPFMMGTYCSKYIFEAFIWLLYTQAYGIAVTWEFGKYLFMIFVVDQIGFQLSKLYIHFENFFCLGIHNTIYWHEALQIKKAVLV
jgi:hypothetical protein